MLFQNPLATVIEDPLDLPLSPPLLRSRKVTGKGG